MASQPMQVDRVPALVEQVQAGIDYERSSAELYNLFFPRVRGFFAKHGFSPDDCEELTQQTFIRVFTAIRDLRFASHFARWLFEIAANIYRNELRRRGAAKRDALEESVEELIECRGQGRSGTVAALSSKALSPLEGALRLERRESLRKKLDQLPPQMRHCVFLRLYQELKYREIAELMKISVETVKAHLHQAQQRLRLTLSDRPDDQEVEGAHGR